MSTRLRVILRTPNGISVRDKYAILTLCQMAKPVSYKRALKELTGSKRARLQAVAASLPKGYSLILVQEPKHTRRNRSYCWDKLPQKMQPRNPVAREPLPIEYLEQLNDAGQVRFVEALEGLVRRRRDRE